jgi:hypothetical protein
VGAETGSCDPGCSWHPDTKKRETFDLLCSSVERFFKTAEKRGSMVGIEGVADRHTLSSIELRFKKKLTRLLNDTAFHCGVIILGFLLSSKNT